MHHHTKAGHFSANVRHPDSNVKFEYFPLYLMNKHLYSLFNVHSGAENLISLLPAVTKVRLIRFYLLHTVQMGMKYDLLD